MKRTRIFFCAAGLSALMLLCACGAPAASDVLSDASLDAAAVSAALPGSKPEADTPPVLTEAQAQGILQELHDSRAEVLLSQPFASPENLNVQSLLQAGFLPVSERAAELQDVLSYPLGGSFDAHTPEEIKAQFLRLTGAEVTQTQLDGITSWKYHAQYDVYCGYLNDFAAPVAEAAAYRRSDGTIVLAYAQAVEADLTSVSGVCLLKRSQDGWQVQQNVRF